MVYSNANGCKHVALLIYDKNLTECIQEWCALSANTKNTMGQGTGKKNEICSEMTMKALFTGYSKNSRMTTSDRSQCDNPRNRPPHVLYHSSDLQ